MWQLSAPPITTGESRAATNDALRVLVMLRLIDWMPKRAREEEREVRSIEHMAYAIYLADCKYDMIGTPGSSVQPAAWDELHEEQQEDYKRHANAVLQHLFEHGRIASYITTPERLAELRAEYDAYLVSVGEQLLKKEGIL